MASNQANTPDGRVWSARCPVLRGARWVGRRLVDQASETFVHSAVDVIASLVANDFDAVLFEDLETESPLWRAIQARDDVRVLERASPHVRWGVRLPPSAELY